MANLINPITDRDIVLATAKKFMTRGEIARSIDRKIHPALIDRIERLAKEGHLFRDAGTKPNGATVYYYRATPEAVRLAKEAETNECQSEQQSFLSIGSQLTDDALQATFLAI